MPSHTPSVTILPLRAGAASRPHATRAVAVDAAADAGGAGTHDVTWSMPLDADDAVDAALQALGIMRDPASVATVFTVTGPDGRRVVVDVEDQTAHRVIASHDPVDATPGPAAVYLVTFADAGGELFATPGVSFRACVQAMRRYIAAVWDEAAVAELATFAEQADGGGWTADQAGDRWTAADLGFRDVPGSRYTVTVTRWRPAVEEP